jgi:uncharacterized protein
MDFGTGETFLHFDEAMQFLDYLRHRAAGTGVRIEAQITTNGTLATVEQLKTCLEKRISLSFSIDGPATAHNFFRRFSDGKPTHRIALKNFRLYRELVRGVKDAPGCTVSSVVAGNARLGDVARYWRKQGVRQYKAIPSEKSRHMGCFQQQELQEIRSRYREDLEEIVTSEVSRLQGSELVENYEGPVGILNAWIHLMRASACRSCGAGYSVIGADAEGTLFPCQGFVGFAERSIGDVHVGVLPAKVAEFRSARTRVESVCDGCWARFLCDGGCCASDPKTGVVFDTKYGCDFAKSHVELAVKSYHIWCGYMMTNAKTPKETQDDPRADELL